jgi:hypothetical protein
MPTDTTSPIAHSPRGAAKAANLGLNAIYNAINEGAMPAKKHGTRTVILDSDLRAWLASLPSYQLRTQAARSPTQTPHVVEVKAGHQLEVSNDRTK